MIKSNKNSKIRLLALVIAFTTILGLNANIASAASSNVTINIEGNSQGGSGGNQGGSGGNQGGSGGNQGGSTGNQGGSGGNQGGSTGNQGGSTGNQGGSTGNQGGSTNDRGDLSGGESTNGDKYYLKPGIHVNSDIKIDGYMNGRGFTNFSPDGYLTRAEFATIVARVFNFDAINNSYKTFDDIQGHWAQKYIEEIAKYNIVNGVSATEFNPDAYLQRDQILIMLYRLMDTTGYSKTTNLIDVTDHYSPEIIATMLNLGIYDKIPSDFDLDAPITRGEIVHLVNNLIYDRDSAVDIETYNFISENHMYQDLLKINDNTYPYFTDCINSIDLSYITSNTEK